MKQPRSESVPVVAVEALKSALGSSLRSVVLFGSRARGEAEPWSDWDILIVATDLPDSAFERHMMLKRALPPEVRAAVAMVARTPQEFEARVPSLYLDIALDGQVLYDPQQYAAQRLGRLRTMIRRAGLRRERTPAGVVWRWEQAPSQPWHLGWGA